MRKISVIQDRQGRIFEEAIPTNLNAEELIELENLLSACIAEHNANSDLKIDLKKYYRQYVPVINNNNEKEIWINCMCEVYDINWKTEVISVADGGECFFNLKVNLSTKKCFNFIINSYA